MVGITSASTKMFLFIPFTLNFTFSTFCIFESVVPKTPIRSYRIGRSSVYLSMISILHFSLFLLSKLMTSALAV